MAANVEAVPKKSKAMMTIMVSKTMSMTKGSCESHPRRFPHLHHHQHFLLLLLLLSLFFFLLLPFPLFLHPSQQAHDLLCRL
jgi:hypothetical protein